MAVKKTNRKPAATAGKKNATPKTKTTSRSGKRPYVQYATIWKSVGGGFSNPGEEKTFKVGSHKVRLKRSERLNLYGNPIHTATVINKDGTEGGSYRGTGSATMIVSKALKINGVETKHKQIFPKKKRR